LVSRFNKVNIINNNENVSLLVEKEIGFGWVLGEFNQN